MTMRRVVAVGALLFLAWGRVAPLSAQALGDLARQEEERRKGLSSRAKVITNKDLGSVPEPSTAPPATPSPTPPSATTPAEPGKDKEAAKDKEADKTDKGPVKDQAYWS